MTCAGRATSAMFALLLGCGSVATPSTTPNAAADAAAPTSSRPVTATSRAPATAAAAGAAASTLAEPSRPSEKFVGIDTSVFFANLEVAKDASLAPTELRMRVRVADGPFGELTKRGLAGAVRDGQLLVTLPKSYPTSRDPVRPQQRQCSYVIDCDAEAVKSLGRDQLSTRPTLPELVHFTSHFISAKSLARGFDIASEVATSHEGDCSEHAVLLAAMARRHHMAARVLFGFAVLTFHHRLPILVGHAWTEVHDGKAWQLADAALVESGVEKLVDLAGFSYLPVQVLEREDLGFRAKLVTEPGAWQVERAEGNF